MMPANQSTPEVTRALKPCPFCGAQAKWVEDNGDFDTPFGLVTEHAETCFLAGVMMADWETIITAWNTRTPARGGDELREASAPLRAMLDSVEGKYGFDDDQPVDTRHFGGLYNDFSPLTLGDLRGLYAAILASTDMAGAGEVLGHEYGPSRVGHGEAQCIHCLATNRENAVIAPNACPQRKAAPPVEGLTSEEGDVRRIVDRFEGYCLAIAHRPPSAKRDEWIGELSILRNMMFAASPKATATASVRELLAEVKLSIECAAGCDEGVDPDTASSEVMSFGGSSLAVAYDKVCASLTDSGTAATIGGERA